MAAKTSGTDPRAAAAKSVRADLALCRKLRDTCKAGDASEFFKVRTAIDTLERTLMERLKTLGG